MRTCRGKSCVSARPPPARWPSPSPSSLTPPPAPAVGLKPDVFEGFKFDLTKPLNQNFFLTHRCGPGSATPPHATLAAGAAWSAQARSLL
jgi:hypothetical protein